MTSIPKDWELLTISSLGEVIGGGTPDTKNDDYWNGDILWAIPTDITNLNGKYISDTQRKISKLGLQKSSAKLLPKYSLLMTSRATIGYCAINLKEICTNQGFQNMIPYERVDVEFLYYMIQSYEVYKKLIRNAYGSTFLEITNRSVKKVKLLVPPIKEQTIIKSIFMNVDNLIFRTQEIIKKLKILKKGLMQRLFTEGIGHTEFNETKVGRIPKGWEIVPMSRIGKVIGGGTPDTKNETYWNGHISWATPTDVTNLQGKYISQTNRNISNEGLSKSSAKILPPFSLLMTSRASIGYCAINTREMSTNQGFQSIIPNKNIDIEFLYYIIQSFKVQNQLVRFAYGSTFSEIPNKDAKKIKIPLPKLDEQQEIVSILSKLDNKIIKENQTKSILKEIKKGLMQDLLTGKRRVKMSN